MDLSRGGSRFHHDHYPLNESSIYDAPWWPFTRRNRLCCNTASEEKQIMHKINLDSTLIFRCLDILSIRAIVAREVGPRFDG